MALPSVLSVTEVAKASLYAYNEKNWDNLRAALAPRFVYNEFGSDRKVQGIDETVSLFRDWARAIPDSKATINKEYVSGTTVVLELTWTGTQSGPLEMPNGTIAPTGNTINVPACQIIETADDKVVSIRHYFNMAALLRQLGVLK